MNTLTQEQINRQAELDAREAELREQEREVKTLEEDREELQDPSTLDEQLKLVRRQRAELERDKMRFAEQVKAAPVNLEEAYAALESRYKLPAGLLARMKPSSLEEAEGMARRISPAFDERDAERLEGMSMEEYKAWRAQQKGSEYGIHHELDPGEPITEAEMDAYKAYREELIHQGNQGEMGTLMDLIPPASREITDAEMQQHIESRDQTQAQIDQEVASVQEPANPDERMAKVEKMSMAAYAKWREQQGG